MNRCALRIEQVQNDDLHSTGDPRGALGAEGPAEATLSGEQGLDPRSRLFRRGPQ